MSFQDLLSKVARELSGERAKRHAGILSQFHRIQASKGFLTATDYVMSQLKKLDDKNCRIHEYVADGTKRNLEWKAPLSWDIEEGKLTLLEPENQVLCRFSEVPESICTHSKSVDTVCELVHIGDGKSENIENKDIRGKIALTTGSPRNMIEKLADLGAAGVIAYPSEERAHGYNEMIQYVGLWPSAENLDKSTFGFSLSRNQALKLIAFIKQKKKVLVRAEINAELYEGKMHVLSAKIEGDLLTNEEIILIAHICHPAPSANDNASGSALLLEIYQTLLSLINSGEIEKPHRTIRFLWVPEFHGTVPWIIEKTSRNDFKPIYCINLDMVGEHPALVGYPFTFSQASVSTPNYLNDLVMEIVEQTKDNPLAIEQGGWQFPWNTRVSSFSGGSDHILFNDEPTRIPSVMFGHPDTFHHTNLDTIEKVDQTTLKRVGITALATSIISSNLNKYVDTIVQSFATGYQKRKANLIKMISNETRNLDEVDEDKNQLIQHILWNTIDSFIEYENRIIRNIKDQFEKYEETIFDFVSQDMKILKETIHQTLFKYQNQELDAKIKEKLDRVPKRKWAGPIDSSKIYKLLMSENIAEEVPSMTENQLNRLKQFFTTSAGNYGGFILEITNLIDNKRTVSKILQLLSLINWKIFDLQILEDFLFYAETIKYIEF